MRGALKSLPPMTQTLLDRLHERAEEPVLWELGREITARELLERANAIGGLLYRGGVTAGAVVGFCGDWGLNTIASFIALFQMGAIAVPFSPGVGGEIDPLSAEADVEWWLDATAGHVEQQERINKHPLIERLRGEGHPGLIVFTSGSSGKPKAILHDVERVASKFSVSRPGWRMVMFLLPDHFGGFNTLLACLVYGGMGICTASRTPDDVCAAVAAARAELLPATPTFLSLLIASGAWRRHDLSSVRLVTYGAEPMSAATLRRLPEIFANADLKQTYGLSELGVLQSASVSRESLWLRVGGRDFETRVVDGMLHIRSRSSMLGYLNAISPIDDDGWMNTGDLVEEKGGLIRIIGRVSDVVNVGGQKVFPVEVESVLQEHPEVAEATVHAVSHPVLGQVVGVKLTLCSTTGNQELVLQEIKLHCKERLQKYKVPMRWELVGIDEHGNERGKKVRR